MGPETEKLLEEALKLPPEARAALAGQLLDSLEEPADPDVEEAWAQEIARRIRDLDVSAVRVVPWSEARRRIAGDR